MMDNWCLSDDEANAFCKHGNPELGGRKISDFFHQKPHFLRSNLCYNHRWRTSDMNEVFTWTWSMTMDGQPQCWILSSSCRSSSLGGVDQYVQDDQMMILIMMMMMIMVIIIMISNLGGVYQYGQDDPATLTKMILFHLPMKSPSSYNHPRFSVQTEVLAASI